MKNKRKPKNICKVDVCNNEIEKVGMCAEHLNKMYPNGYKRERNKGKHDHPLRKIWGERHGYGSFPFEWMDFWQFVKDVGERPSKNHYLVKKDRTKSYGKDNVAWLEHIRRQPDESEKDWVARKWARRIELNPDVNRNRGIFYKLGMSPTDYAETVQRITEEQKDLCAICEKPEVSVESKTKKVHRLALDHCHKTMKIRGLLCSRGNRTLGMLEESVPILKGMIKYIQHYLENPSDIEYTKLTKFEVLYHKLKEERRLCEICHKPETRKHKSGQTFRLALDHCHTTNKVRGILCQRCNTQLGRMEESIPILQSMIKYIEKHSA